MESPTKNEFMNFVKTIGRACKFRGGGFDPSHPLKHLPFTMVALSSSLNEMLNWVDEFPPEQTTENNLRFGNPSFRRWMNRLVERSDAIITTLLQIRDDLQITSQEEAWNLGKAAASGLVKLTGDNSVAQVSCYLNCSFGDSIRIDYGSGHESVFMIMLLVLTKVKCLGESPTQTTLQAVGISVFYQYLKVTRKLQVQYRLEPAGSRGVWGIDDYHCLAFYLGSCQLQGISSSLPELQDPKCIIDEQIIKDYGDTFIYLGCIRHIREMKRGAPFFESSPMLYDISQTLPTWDRVSRGLIRLYEGEVLNKRVVVQHFLFTNLFPCTWAPSRDERTATRQIFLPEDNLLNLQN